MKILEKILLTGASGFIGQNIIKSNKNFFIYGIVNKNTNNNFQSNNVKYLKIDLLKKNFISKLPRDIDYILHFAQSPKYKKDLFAIDDIMQINFNATVELLKFASLIKIKKFIYASSGSIYDPKSKYQLRENEIIKPNSAYGMSKFFSERIIEKYNNYFDILSLRIFFPYIINSLNGKGYLNFLLNNIIYNKENFIDLSENFYFKPLDVRDLSYIVLKFLKIKNQQSIINLSGLKTFESYDLSKKIITKMNIKKRIIKPKKTLNFDNSNYYLNKYISKNDYKFNFDISSFIKNNYL